MLDFNQLKEKADRYVASVDRLYADYKNVQRAMVQDEVIAENYVVPSFREAFDDVKTSSVDIHDSLEGIDFDSLLTNIKSNINQNIEQ